MFILIHNQQTTLFNSVHFYALFMLYIHKTYPPYDAVHIQERKKLNFMVSLYIDFEFLTLDEDYPQTITSHSIYGLVMKIVENLPHIYVLSQAFYIYIIKYMYRETLSLHFTSSHRRHHHHPQFPDFKSLIPLFCSEISCFL